MKNLKKEPNIIDNWLEKNGNQEIAKQVEIEAEELSKQETLEEVNTSSLENLLENNYDFNVQFHQLKRESIFSFAVAIYGESLSFKEWQEKHYGKHIEISKWQQEQDKNKYSGGDVPNNLESVLAKITHQNDLGLSQWYEVVYYDNDTEKWCCYSGSKTFQDGERVIEWKYCKDCL